MINTTFKKDKELYLKNQHLFTEKDPRKNASGCNDPTAYQAMKNIDEEEEEFKKLFRTLRYICKVAGFEFDGRIRIRNKESGRVYK